MSLDLAFERHGGGPPVIVLHGLLGRGRNWTQIARRMGERFSVLAPDLRNHGDSPWADSMTYAEMAQDVARLLDREGLERAAVIGHSMGGKVAMTLALQAPGRVERLVVADVAPAGYDRSFLHYIEAMQAIDLSRVAARSDADRALAGTVAEPGVRGFLLQNLELGEGAPRWKPNLEALGACMDELVAFPEAGGRLYDGPTLFVSGARSDYVRPEHRPTIERLFARARLVSIKDAGHWLHAEQPERFLATVVPFLEAPEAG